VQECLANIHRHSGSASAEIRGARDGEGVSLVVQDREKESRQKSCRKFSRKVRAQESEASGERARHFGGHMLIESNHKGTKISFKFASPQNAPSEPEDIVPQEDTAQPA
jgi:signal transduction histidine kinase